MNLEKKPRESSAIEDGDGLSVTYGELCDFTQEFCAAIPGRCIILIITENCAGACAGYVAAMSSGSVPILLSHTLSDEALSAFMTTYGPSLLWVPEQRVGDFPFEVRLRKYGYALLDTGEQPFDMAPELRLLLPTSGSTSSPKLVRHTLQNVESNARAVADVFGLDGGSRGMVSLPLNFTQGLNVATSHLIAGGTALLTRAGLTQREFWQFFRESGAQSFTGVPYSYEVLNRLRFFTMKLPELKIINQGGGRMTDALFSACARYAAETGRRFVATYGSTETTSRMTYLPPELAVQKTGSIGVPLPGCSITLRDENGDEIHQADSIGEIVFHGPNVTMGYAVSRDDLLLGDERNGVYATGDMAYRDADGCYYIVGRKSRFLKLYSFRIGLDETERLLSGKFGIECACVGSDEKMRVYTTAQGTETELADFLSANFSIPKSAFEVRHIDSIPKNDAGKKLYSALQ